MLETLLNLYEEGKLKPGGLFEKTAQAIVRNELEKLAGFFDYFTRSAAPLSQELLKDIVRSSADPKTMMDAISRLRELSPMEQAVILKERVAPSQGLLGSIKARLAANPLAAKGLGVGAAVAGIGLASHLANKIQESKQRKTQESALESVLARNPDYDKDRAKELFSVLQDVAPSLASNPVSVEGYIQPHLQWETLPYTAIKDLAQIEKNISDARSTDSGLFSDAFSEVGASLATLLSLGS